ncbi:MAG: tryptophan--tRNA ligase [Chloroflexota bacterium]|nr:tryptophan--tRNA ligase [Chloroflexota bacterium]
MNSFARKKRVLSGIQPSGTLHIGNFIGAISMWVEQQDTYENLFCVADLHALTMPEAIAPARLRELARETAALYVACGVDPEKSAVFPQSDVPEHTYLAWVLLCCTPVGWLEGMNQYKTKAALSESIGSGLLTYPALQAADILIYKADYVPVGDDQKQHIELARDVAQRFNRLYAEGFFPLPKVLTRSSGARIMALDDPSIKMSKSLEGMRRDHAVTLLDSPDTIRKTIMSAVTDSGSDIRFEHASAGVRNLLTLYEVLSAEPRNSIEERFAGTGYGWLKRDLVSLIVEKLEPVQKRYRQITADQGYLDHLLAEGAGKAGAIAGKTLEAVKQLTGLGPTHTRYTSPTEARDQGLAIGSPTPTRQVGGGP